MKKIFVIFSLVLQVVFPFTKTGAQPLRRLNSFSYNMNNGLLQSFIEDMNFDGLGFMWLSFETGLQRYDGNSFKNVPVQNGLPDNQYIKFIKSSNGKLWLCHSKGISIYEAATDHFTLIYSYRSKVSKPAIWPINEDDGVVYFYESDGYIIGIDENKFQMVSRSRFPFDTDRLELPEEFQTAGVPLNHEVIICFRNKILLTWNLKTGLVSRMFQLPEKIQITGQDFHVLNKDAVMFFNGGKLTVLNMKENTFTVFAKSEVNRPQVDGVTFENFNHPQLVMSVSNELFLFNTETMQPIARFVNFQNQPFAHFSIRYIRFDNYGNIYLVTRSEGFVKLLADTYPISYYGSNVKQFNFITCLEVDKENNRVLAGTFNSGFLVFDTLQQLRQHIEQIGAFQQPGPLTIVSIVHLAKDNYLLFPRFNKSCVLWNAATGSLKRVPIKIQATDSSDKTGQIGNIIAYYCSPDLSFAHCKVLAIDQNFYQIDLSGRLPVVKTFLFAYRTKGLCRYHNYILSGTEEQLLFRDTLNYSVIKKILIPGCGEIRCIGTYDNDIYVGSDHGLYKLDGAGKIISHLDKTDGLADDYIYALAIDSKGNIWCSTNKGIIKISPNNGILHLKKEDGLQENEFNTNILAQEEDGQLFFGGVNGINSFYPDQINDISDSPKVFLTGIGVNGQESFKDLATWSMKQIILPYDQNNLYFEFMALGKKNPEQYFYQYRMVNVDKNWIKSADLRNARYLLQPGKYFFQLYAGNGYNENPKRIKTVEVTIKAPFWETYWFRTMLVLLFMTIIALAVRQYLHRRYQKKLRTLQLQNEIQNERERISRDLHDNIGGQLSFISSSIDWVIDKNKDMDKVEELKQLKAINTSAKKVMGNLRETIWALHKDSITLLEFSDKLKVYIQNMLQLQPGLEFKTEEKITANIILTPAEMLNIFRICQECVNNTLKHADASRLTFAIRSDTDTFHIRMEDNGAGFDATDISDEHFGLKNMKHRAVEVNAKLSIKTEKEKGTIVEIDKYSK